jgi:hypothetical protein
MIFPNITFLTIVQQCIFSQITLDFVTRVLIFLFSCFFSMFYFCVCFFYICDFVAVFFLLQMCFDPQALKFFYSRLFLGRNYFYWNYSRVSLFHYCKMLFLLYVVFVLRPLKFRSSHRCVPFLRRRTHLSLFHYSKMLFLL